MSSEKQQKRIIVCGVGFGQFYLKAIEMLPEKYKLVGIFSKGSNWSKEIAKSYDVPLYTDIDEITKDMVDVVCVVIKSTVVGGKGSDITHAFLEKGIHVVQEYPIHSSDYIECLKLSRQHHCHYLLDTFYSELPNVSEFIKLAQKLDETCGIQYIQADCSVHVLMPLIDILGMIAGGIRPWTFNTVTKATDDALFTTVLGIIKNIPLCLNIQNQMEPKDPENNMNLFHRIIVSTSSGNIMLTGTNCPTVWEGCMNKLVQSDGFYHLNAEEEESALPAYEILESTSQISYPKVAATVWPKSIKETLSKFYNQLVEGKPDYARIQYLSEVENVWTELGNAIGSAQIINEYKKKTIRIKELL